MSTLLIRDFTFIGPPVPYVRMTRTGIWTKAAQNYLGYKEALAEALKSKYPALVLPEPPPTSQKKERAAYNKEHRQATYELEVHVILHRERGDGDNYFKTVADALEHAGILWNDKRIKRGCFCVDESKQYSCERIQFRLWEL